MAQKLEYGSVRHHDEIAAALDHVTAKGVVPLTAKRGKRLGPTRSAHKFLKRTNRRAADEFEFERSHFSLRRLRFELLRDRRRNGVLARVDVGTKLVAGDLLPCLAGRPLDRQDPFGGDALTAAQDLRNCWLRNIHNLANRRLVSQNCDRDFQCINANPAHKHDDKPVY